MIIILCRKICVACVVSCLFNVLGVLSIEQATTVPPNVQDILKNVNESEVKSALNSSRRILNGQEANSNKPYMVYLKLPTTSSKEKDYRTWLCGGVIVHEEYILTSAACIEDVGHFYIISGTYKYSPTDDRYTNPCIKNGARKAVWKCIPRNYVFDGHENDNIRWMNNDIAIVKIDEEFDFTRRVRGCDYIPKPVCYNNDSAKLEEPGTVGMIAGWGTTERYRDWVNARRNDEEVVLLDTKVEIMAKNRCKKRWGKRYHTIIDNYMICTRDMSPEMSEMCAEKYVDCTDIHYSEEDGRRRVVDPETLQLHSAHHSANDSRRQISSSGGFCENDHGGPLVHGTGVNSVVIGIISACLVKERSNKCYGPFLYTSVYKNRVLINCAIYKETGGACTSLFRSSVTHTEVEMSWLDHPDGPAKNEIKLMRRQQEEEQRKSTLTANSMTPLVDLLNKVTDLPDKQKGGILRSGVEIPEQQDNTNISSSTSSA